MNDIDHKIAEVRAEQKSQNERMAQVRREAKARAEAANAAILRTIGKANKRAV